MATKETLLRELPPYADEWILITENQYVPDIIKELKQSHKDFAPYYDRIAHYFDADTNEEIANNLYNFLKREVRYKEEGVKRQTSALPTGILHRGYGDCKHYASFIGGVLDALNRMGRNIKWNYRFGSYKLFSTTPHHVFVVINDDGQELWIDPTPGTDDKDPWWYTDRKVKATTNMALYRNIAGVDDTAETQSMGVALPWGQIAQSALSVVTNIFGKDNVPNYPVKETKTFNSLKASLLNDWVGTVAPGGNFEVVPRSIDEAKSMLAKARKRKQEEIDLGHGYGDGPGWDTLQMLYDETIKALELFIQAADHISTTGTMPEYTAAASEQKSSSMGKILPVAALLGVGYFLFKPKSKKVSGMDSTTGLLIIGGGAFLLYALSKRSTSSTDESKRSALKNLEAHPAWDKMNSQEINDSYSLVFDYIQQGKTVPADLRQRIDVISSKYNIFT